MRRRGRWHALATLVRPLLKTLEYPESTETPCVLTGLNLFLLDSVSNDADFNQAVRVQMVSRRRPATGAAPLDGRLYGQAFRDDPKVVSLAVVKHKPMAAGSSQATQQCDSPSTPSAPPPPPAPER